MKVAINLVVTCTKRKRLPVPSCLRFRSVRTAPLEDKMALWLERLRSANTEQRCVHDLYAGDYWKIASSLKDVKIARGSPIHIWIASAGYGLVSLYDRIKPYSATFSRSHPDSIARKTRGGDPRSIFRDWWRLMAQWAGPARGGPRTIAAIAAESPKSPMVVIASTNYLAAIEDDLRLAVQNLADPDRFSIISAGCKSLDGLSRHLVPCDARLQRVVGGALRSLNIRVARKVLSECHSSLPTLPVLRRVLIPVLRKQPPPTRLIRQPATDKDLIRFIARELHQNRTARHTPLLRKLRDQGNACEQSRFASLYRSVLEQLNAT